MQLILYSKQVKSIEHHKPLDQLLDSQPVKVQLTPIYNESLGRTD